MGGRRNEVKEGEVAKTNGNRGRGRVRRMKTDDGRMAMLLQVLIVITALTSTEL